jgi:hypothetical protein
MYMIRDLRQMLFAILVYLNHHYIIKASRTENYTVVVMLCHDQISISHLVIPATLSDGHHITSMRATMFNLCEFILDFDA